MAASTKRKPAKTKKIRRPWRDEYFLRCHELAKSGMALETIAKTLGVPRQLFAAWVKSKPALKEAIDRGRPAAPAVPNAGQTFLDHVYAHLPPPLQELWEEIEAVDADAKQGPPRGGVKSFDRRFRPDRIDRLFTDCGIKRARQSLWIHALVASNFNASEACRKVNVSRQAVDHWRATEPDFDSLFDQIDVMKKDFGESCLFRAMALNEVRASVFFNATKNADRGYVKPASQKNVNHSGSLVTTHVELDRVLDKLPLDQRRALLDAMNAADEPKTVTALPEHVNEG